MIYRLLLILAALAAAAPPLYAQPQPYTVALVDGLSGRVLLVDRAGAVAADVTLPRPAGQPAPAQIAVSPGAATFAYVGVGAQPQLVIYDRATATPVQVPLPAQVTGDSLSFVAGGLPFTPDGSRLAFGYAVADGTWGVAVYDRAAGWSPVATLDQRAAFPGMAAVDVLGRTPIVAGVAADGAVTLVLAEPFSGYAANFADVFTWDPASGALARQPFPATIDRDRAPDGAQVTTLYDPAQPNSADAFPYPQANALYLTAPDGTRRLLFTAANVSLFWPRFVGNGAAVWVGGYSPQNRLTWFLLDRASGDLLTSQFPPVQMTGVAGTPEGFVYTVEAGANAGTLLNVVPYDNGVLGEPVQIWAGEPGASYRVVWAGA